MMRHFSHYLASFFVIILGLYFNACDSKDEFDAMGMFEADEVLVSTEIGGKILSFPIKEGEYLTHGQKVAQIDTHNLVLSEQKLQAQIDNAKREQERMRRLVKANAGIKKNLDDAEFYADLLQKELAILQDKIQKGSIISPINGVVLEKYAFEGELSAPNKALFKIADTQTLRLKAYLIHDDITQIKLGDKVRIFSDFRQNYKEHEGVISWISSKAEFTPKTIMTKDERENLVYAIKVDVKNDGYLKIGSYGEIKLIRK